MIKVTIEETIKGAKIDRKITTEGHAHGEDHTAICSACSMLMQSLALFLAKRYPYFMDADLKDGSSFVQCEMDIADKVVATAFQMTQEGLTSLYNRYPKQIDIV